MFVNADSARAKAGLLLAASAPSFAMPWAPWGWHHGTGAPQVHAVLLNQ